MNLVYRHPSGGSLWQGGRLSSGNVPMLDKAGIKAVMFGAIEFQPHLPDRFDVLRVRAYDNPFMSQDEANRYAACADEVSDMLAAYIAGGENVLSSCWAGWNRSGLMTATTLMKLGIPADLAIARVRAARGPSALGNPVFVEIIKSADRRLARTA